MNNAPWRLLTRTERYGVRVEKVWMYDQISNKELYELRGEGWREIK